MAVDSDKNQGGNPRIREVIKSEYLVEFVASQLMMGLEIMHDMDAFPAKYGLGPDQVNALPTEPIARWAIDHIGDMWEISAGFLTLRIAFVAVNEVIKKIADGKEIPDDIGFWASLTTVVIVKAIHSLGYISLFHIHDHMDHPVPEMLFGQAVAAVVLATVHYAVKYREPLTDLAKRVGKKSLMIGEQIDKKLKSFPGINTEY